MRTACNACATFTVVMDAAPGFGLPVPRKASSAVPSASRSAATVPSPEAAASASMRLISMASIVHREGFASLGKRVEWLDEEIVANRLKLRKLFVHAEVGYYDSQDAAHLVV